MKRFIKICEGEVVWFLGCDCEIYVSVLVDTIVL